MGDSTNTTSEARFRPFANGSQWADWEGANCDRCTKSELDSDGLWPVRCDILKALLEAQMDDGTIPLSIGIRMGTSPDEPRYCWPCTEVEWTQAHLDDWAQKRGYANHAAYMASANGTPA